MRIDEIMTRRVITVTPDDTLGTVRFHFRSAGIHHLLVLEAGRVVGVLSMHELAAKSDDVKVRGAMSVHFTSVAPDLPVRSAAAKMIGGGHGCVPVVDNGKLVGIVMTTDLMHSVMRV